MQLGANMKKIVLTSTGFTNKNIEKKFLELVKLPSDKIKAMFIPTAAITEDAKEVVPLCKEDLLIAGILESNIVAYDLDRIISCDEICNFNIIYVCGGTTEYLLDRMNYVKFNIPLKKFLDNGGVYIGVSAGSVALAQNLPENLGYINCILNVHQEEGIDTRHCPTIKLTDNQAIIIEDSSMIIME